MRQQSKKQHKVKEIDSKLNLTSTEYSTIKEQVSKSQELTIQQLRRKKTRKYRQLNYGEQIPEKQTRNSSVKFSRSRRKKQQLQPVQYQKNIRCSFKKQSTI